MLTTMDKKNKYEDTLAEAARVVYAEEDPTDIQ